MSKADDARLSAISTREMDDLYNDNSLAQASLHDISARTLATAAENAAHAVCKRNAKMAKAMVLGCGPGHNDITALQRHVLPAFLKRDISVQVLFVDLPTNNWGQLLREAACQFTDNRVSVRIYGGSYMDEICPASSIDFAMCFSALHWIDALPFPASRIQNGAMCYVALEQPLKQSLRHYKDVQLQKFVQARCTELAVGGQCVLVFDGEYEGKAEAQFYQPTRLVQESVAELVKEGQLPETALKFFVMTQSFSEQRIRTQLHATEQCQACSVDLKAIPCPMLLKFQSKSEMKKDDGESRQAYGEEISGAIMSCVSSKLAEHVPNGPQGQACINTVKDRVAAKAASDPSNRTSTAGVTAFVHFSKTAAGAQSADGESQFVQTYGAAILAATTALIAGVCVLRKK